MEFEQEAAYALASWARFDSALTDELQRAVTSAFALVAAADGDFSGAEVDRFVLLLRERSEVLAPLDIDLVDHLFRDIGGALLSDPAKGRQRALGFIAGVRGNADHCELVRSAAEIALAADNRKLASEQNVLGDICPVLEIAVREP